MTDESTGETHTWTIVGVTEADRAAGKLSAESPVARALLDQPAGATVSVRPPGANGASRSSASSSSRSAWPVWIGAAPPASRGYKGPPGPRTRPRLTVARCLAPAVAPGRTRGPTDWRAR